MTLWDKKQLTIKSFGTDKAKRKQESLMLNRVDEDVNDPTTMKRSKKGTRDDRLQEMAEKVID